MDLETRLRKALLVKEHYADFLTFAHDAILQLGFTMTDMQADMSEYIAYGPSSRLVMAQRGEAKSTFGCIYGVWQIVQDLNHTVLVVTDGDRQAKANSTLIVGLIRNWDILDYLRPDPAAGDRTSIEAYDIHHSLRSVVAIADKTPSVSCMSIFGQLTGARAKTLIADDVETAKRAIHAGDREKIYLLSREFDAICTTGNILYLGTPHHRESLYNRITTEGVDVRIWPGRVPSVEQEKRYGNKLAPYIRKLISIHGEASRTGYGVRGDKGMPTDPQLRDEENLVRQEMRWGEAGFDLQYMLDTTLTDENRQHLRIADLIFADFSGDKFPEIVIYSNAKEYLTPVPAGFSVGTAKMYRPILPDDVKWVNPDNNEIVMVIDPAGGGGDEVAWAVGCAVKPYIHVLHVGGLVGGLTEDNGRAIVEIAKKFGVKVIEVESNMGHGLFEINLRGVLARMEVVGIDVVGKYVSGNKFKRIIDSLATPFQRHRVIFHRSAVDSDIYYCSKHGTDKAINFSLFHQLENITYDTGSILKDDRADALSALIRRFKHVLDQDEERAKQKRREHAGKEFVRNPMGHKDLDKPEASGTLQRLRARRSTSRKPIRKRRR